MGFKKINILRPTSLTVCYLLRKRESALLYVACPFGTKLVTSKRKRLISHKQDRNIFTAVSFPHNALSVGIVKIGEKHAISRTQAE